jgi:hypothetical protein
MSASSAAKLQVHRTGTPGHRRAEGLAHHVRKARDVVDRGVELGHRLERRHVVDLLIDFAKLCFRFAASGHRDHRRMREPGIAQSRGKIECADHLRHADAGLARSARVAIGHIGGGFLAMHVQPLDVGAALHFGEGGAQHRRHMKYMRYAIAFEHVGKALRASHLAIVSELHSFPHAVSKLINPDLSTSLRAKRSNPDNSLEGWIASSLRSSQ